MPVKPDARSTPLGASGLSARSQHLWLTAIRHRQLADAIALDPRKAALTK